MRRAIAGLVLLFAGIAVFAGTEKIRIYSKNGVSEQWISAANSAAGLWSSYLENEKTIYIRMDYETLKPDLPMITDVVYVESGTLITPSALASQKSVYGFGSEYSPDAVVRINKSYDWSGSDKYLYMLRAIGVGLGFGSSVTSFDKSGTIVFQEGRNRSVFDKMLFSGATVLGELDSGSEFLSDFAKSGDVYVLENKPEYKVYSPAAFELGRSLVFLDNPESIMHYNPDECEISSYIDNTTLTLLNEAGWRFPLQGEAAIMCDEMSDGSQFSIYQKHDYRLSVSSSDGMSDFLWTYKLSLADGGELTVASVHSSTFSTPAVPFGSDMLVSLKRDAYGYTMGRIECEYRQNGVTYKVPHLDLRLDLKPIVEIESAVSSAVYDSYFYDLTVNVKCAGADYCYAHYVPEWGGPFVNQEFPDGPSEFEVVFKKLYSFELNYVTVVGVNDFGGTFVTEVFEGPDYSPQTVKKSMAGTREGFDDGVYVVEVFDASGVMVGKGCDEIDVAAGLAPGVYVIRKVSGGNVGYEKVVKQ